MALLRINSLIEESIVDGPGLRLVVFTQGCCHKCPDCHNPQTHDPLKGTVVDTSEILQTVAQNPLLQGITFSGGEPFLQPGPLAELGEQAHLLGLDIVTYTGFTYETLKADRRPEVAALLAVTDLLIDGPFMPHLKNTALPYRGSSNQRLIPLSQTIVPYLS